eukprot:SAG11_NODE_2611_length_3173_cov_1.719909_1_plen_211_part_00
MAVEAVAVVAAAQSTNDPFQKTKIKQIFVVHPHNMPSAERGPMPAGRRVRRLVGCCHPAWWELCRHTPHLIGLPCTTWRRPTFLSFPPTRIVRSLHCFHRLLRIQVQQPDFVVQDNVIYCQYSIVDTLAKCRRRVLRTARVAARQLPRHGRDHRNSAEKQLHALPPTLRRSLQLLLAVLSPASTLRRFLLLFKFLPPRVVVYLWVVRWPA